MKFSWWLAFVLVEFGFPPNDVFPGNVHNPLLIGIDVKRQFRR